jgi:hypothetical protein
MPRSPGGVSRVAHAACPAAPLYDPPDTARRATCSCPAEPAKELSGRSARSLGAGEPARPKCARHRVEALEQEA